MAVFLLVPGAWHGAWCWDLCAPRLRQAGHEVITPDLAPVPAGANPLPIWAAQIATLAEQAGTPVIAVGHSRGGLVIGEAAEHAPHAFAQLIYVSGFLLPAGTSIQDASARPEAGPAPDYLRPARSRCLAVAPDLIIPRFYPLAPPDLATQAAARLHPEPIASFSSPATITPARFGQIPRAYIECTQDLIIPLALQRSMQTTLACAQTATLPTDHSPFLSMPDELAAALVFQGGRCPP